MICEKCGSDNVNIQITTESKLVTKHHGIIWWLCIGWWWIPIKWLFLTVPALFVAIFIGKRKKSKILITKWQFAKNVVITGKLNKKSLLLEQ